jgi:hypothetical protein
MDFADEPNATLTALTDSERLEAEFTALPKNAPAAPIATPATAKFLLSDPTEFCRVAKLALACFRPLGSKLVRMGILIAISEP